MKTDSGSRPITEGGATETPRDIAFCAHAILDDELFVVHDASSDERFADNPLVIGSPDIRFYAGAPVRLSDGHRVGTLCVIDRRPLQLDATQREVLLSLSKAVSRALEGRHAAKRLREAMNALEVQREMLDAMLRSIEDAVLATDATGRIQWANPAADRLLGSSARKLKGRSLRRMLAWMAGRHLNGPLHRVSVNLSGQSLAAPTLRTWALPSLEEAVDFVRAMQSTGARVALDDFGAVASTFRYLKTLPVDCLKIDGQFIRHLLTDPLDQTAVKCFVDVARTVDLKAVAEHVETDAVLERLRELGVDFAQGYLLHRPAPMDAACRDGACAGPVAKPSLEPARPRSMVVSQTKA